MARFTIRLLGVGELPVEGFLLPAVMPAVATFGVRSPASPNSPTLSQSSQYPPPPLSPELPLWDTNDPMPTTDPME